MKYVFQTGIRFYASFLKKNCLQKEQQKSLRGKQILRKNSEILGFFQTFSMEIFKIREKDNFIVLT